MSSFGDASELCVHCQGHHHEHHATESVSDVIEFNAKCCCEDFDSEIGFTDNFTFSTDKPLMVYLPFTALGTMFHAGLDQEVIPLFRFFTQEKIPYLLTGRLKTIFFSSLKLNPLVF